MNNLLFKTILLKGEDGSSIKSIEKTNTVGLVDTYTITLDNGDTTTFDVTNGASIESIELTSRDNYVDTYTVNLTDGTTTSFNVTNGQAYTIPKDSVVYYEGNDTPEGYVDTNPPSGSGDFAEIDDTAPSSSKVYSSNKINTDYPFKFGVDDNGNYGYYKAGADTVTPFKSAKASGIGDIHNGFYFGTVATAKAFFPIIQNTGTMTITLNDSIKFTWNGRMYIGAEVLLIPRIDKSAKKIKYKAKTGTSYSVTIDDYKLYVGVVSEEPSHTNVIEIPQQGLIKYNVFAENNAIFEGELDISDIDSDLYLVICAHGWNVEFTELTIE